MMKYKQSHILIYEIGNYGHDYKDNKIKAETNAFHYELYCYDCLIVIFLLNHVFTSHFVKVGNWNAPPHCLISVQYYHCNKEYFQFWYHILCDGVANEIETRHYHPKYHNDVEYFVVIQLTVEEVGIKRKIN